MRRKGLWMLLLAVLLLWPASAVFAGEPTIYADGGQIFVDEDVSLEPGETLSGDVGVFNGDLTVPEGSVVDGSVFVTNGDAEVSGQVRGDLAVISGDLVLAQSGRVHGDVFVMSGDQEISGRVDGDLSVMFGDIEVLSSAVVGGDVVVLSGGLSREAGAQVRGEQMSEFPLPRVPLIPERSRIPETPARPESPKIPERPLAPTGLRHDTLGDRVSHLMGRVVSTGFMSLIFIATGLLIVVIWPKATHRVADCITAAPAQSFGLGLLTFVIAAVLESLAVVLMIIIILVAAALISTVILIPVGLLLILLSVLVLFPVILAVIAAMVLGWVALAEVIGRKVLQVLKADNVKSLGAVLVGLLLSVALAGTLWLFEPLCCGWPFIILLTSIGVGAVIHSRFGKQQCTGSGAPAEAGVLPIEAMDEEAGQPDAP